MFCNGNVKSIFEIIINENFKEMKKTNLLTLAMLFLLGMFVIQSCATDDDEVDPITELIADDSTFAGFETWDLISTSTGADPASLIFGGAHAGDSEDSTRDVYLKDNVSAINGEYPIGTLIVKHTYTSTETIMYTAMVKRGNGFNPANSDWEWFVINEDGSIAVDADGAIMRGANLMNGMCGGCHGAAATDYVFSK